MYHTSYPSHHVAPTSPVNSEPSCSIAPDIQLSLFEELPPSFEPESWWLDGHTPNHPLFDDAARIRFWTKTIKRDLLQFIVEGCQLLVDAKASESLISTLVTYRTLWEASVSVCKYGVVYLASRSDCRDDFLPAIQKNPNIFDSIDAFLMTDSNCIRAINYGVHRFVNNITVYHPGKLVPPRAISALGPYRAAVRPQDFDGDSVAMLDITTPLWDLHDFSHLTAASLAPELFGSKYFTSLVHLPSPLTALVRSPGMKTADPKPACSDGVVFSELMTGLYTAEVDAVQRGDKTHTYASITEAMAKSVANYLRGEQELRHGTTGQMISMKKPITAVQLAVLVQNKAYELVASDMEQRAMTRGGPAGDARDELDSLTSNDRVLFLANCRRWMYFEVRNTTKHRAHKLAYKTVAEDMLADCERDITAAREASLLRDILDNIHYKGWENKKTSNLWQVVRDYLAVS
ncbi:hypothetical protein PVAG01_05760 [Phlyctema vagabunda]|uniref:Uncharacterized protein n=1 Tax=Phlyctema vagabunda TaxID=108571 RepID=A0ABR4PE98_9HELO